MALYRRSKLCFDAIFSCYNVPKTRDPVSLAISKHNNIRYFTKCTYSTNCPLKVSARKSLFSPRVTIDRSLRFQSFGSGYRSYYTRAQFERWLRDPENFWTIVAFAVSGIGATIYFGTETIPYTKRKHIILLPKVLERWLGVFVFVRMKGEYILRRKLLPETHPDSIRVKKIANDILEALQRELKQKEKELLTDLNNEKSGEFLDVKCVDQSCRMKGNDNNVAIEHLEGLNWEILVVDDKMINAFCVPGGKIVVFTGLLKHFTTDDEIATIIGHEVAHAVARHSAETITKSIWLIFGQLLLADYVKPDQARTISHLLFELPFSRRMEIEADHIGLLLMASAGYDPRIAPKVYEKLGKVAGDLGFLDYLSTHPSAKKRCKLLSEASVMNEALAIYRTDESLVD
uniref:mitochondrial metalloendopeptidase OMA1-like n=1 Tax=Erigeron canadensis TaxID=72917 RepID=UPI001CB98068|nr:mitochondrial metalloendopeptidase OMA1-like [Erigeron canadensis]